MYTVFLGNEPGHWPIPYTAVVLLLETADCIQDLRIESRIRMPEMIVIALSGYICNTTEQAYGSDSGSEDFVNGLVSCFFLKLTAGVPLISIRVSR